MSTVIVLAPVIISNWPAITIAAAGAAAALGFTVKKTAQETMQQVQETEQTVEIELPDSEVLAQSLATEQKMVMTKGSVRITVQRDARGQCKVCASGKGHGRVELEQMAHQFTEKLTQCFIYDKVVRELKNKNFQVVNEEVMQDESIRIHVRRWVD